VSKQRVPEKRIHTSVPMSQMQMNSEMRDIAQPTTLKDIPEQMPAPAPEGGEKPSDPFEIFSDVTSQELRATRNSRHSNESDNQPQGQNAQFDQQTFTQLSEQFKNQSFGQQNENQNQNQQNNQNQNNNQQGQQGQQQNNAPSPKMSRNRPSPRMYRRVSSTVTSVVPVTEQASSQQSQSSGLSEQSNQQGNSNWGSQQRDSLGSNAMSGASLDAGLSSGLRQEGMQSTLQNNDTLRATDANFSSDMRSDEASMGTQEEVQPLLQSDQLRSKTDMSGDRKDLDNLSTAATYGSTSTTPSTDSSLLSNDKSSLQSNENWDKGSANFASDRQGLQGNDLAQMSGTNLGDQKSGAVNSDLQRAEQDERSQINQSEAGDWDKLKSSDSDQQGGSQADNDSEEKKKEPSFLSKIAAHIHLPLMHHHDASEGKANGNDHAASDKA